MNHVDPHVIRTERLLIDALTNLILEEGYDVVNVRKIVQRAGLNRSTFYLHFRDKQDILGCA
ncbi:helix-turn-helix domain-containing protein [Alicyclobacillus fodiniaquatilis]|uniref:Helix-turn-helix domain-containing protein n=1 Tax=Alicyclobacillus fodiniaquatilis TaxID=1661150 RepID=A0ABW4JIB4_9BACL